MTTTRMEVFDNGECIGTVPIGELPALIRCRTVCSPPGTCTWTYDVFGPVGECLARGIESHADARRIALAFGYIPLECWATTPREEVAS
jgi:hypothetical protein